jgi:hypothetical protein
VILVLENDYPLDSGEVRRRTVFIDELFEQVKAIVTIVAALAKGQVVVPQAQANRLGVQLSADKLQLIRVHTMQLARDLETKQRCFLDDETAFFGERVLVDHVAELLGKVKQSDGLGRSCLNTC